MSEFVTKEEFLKFQQQMQNFKGQENKASLVVFSGSVRLSSLLFYLCNKFPRGSLFVTLSIERPCYIFWSR